MHLSALIIGQDLATALLGALNAGYFAGYWQRSVHAQARRAGASALVVLSGAAVAEAAFSQSVLWSDSIDVLPDIAWALLRLPLLAGTALLSAIIARRVWG